MRMSARPEVARGRIGPGRGVSLRLEREREVGLTCSGPSRRAVLVQVQFDCAGDGANPAGRRVEEVVDVVLRD